MANSVVQTIKDAEVDARSLSEFIYKPASFMVSRRLAPPVHTLDYYLNEFSATINAVVNDAANQVSEAISNAGYRPLGTFAAGATLTKPNDVLEAIGGKLYRWAGALPKTVPVGSTPDNTGGFGSNAWLEVSDSSLSQKLSGLGGASTIGSGVSVFNNLAEFLGAESKIRDGSKVFLLSLHQGLDLEGEGRVYTYSKANPKDISHATNSGFLSRDFDGKIFIAEFGATGGDEASDASRGTDTNALQSCLDVIREKGGGVLSMGINCLYHLGGQLTGDVSNLDWQFNGTKVILGDLSIRWSPLTHEYGSYKNVRISGGEFVANRFKLLNSAGRSFGGGLFLSLAKVDGVYFTNNKLVECTYTHVLDLMGSRYVYFEDNEVLGSPLGTTEYNEVVQVSNASVASWGATPRPETEQFFDNKPTTHVYVRNNTYKPFTNPDTNETTYPCRPVGDHSYSVGTRELYFEDNYVENVMTQIARTPYTISMMNLLGHDIHINRNTFISNTGNGIAIQVEGLNGAAVDAGVKPVFEITGNKIYISNVTTDDKLTFRCITFKYINSGGGSQYPESRLGYDLSITNNTIDTDYSNNTLKASSNFFVDTNLRNANIVFSDNISRNTTAISLFQVNSGWGFDRAGSKCHVYRNEFHGNTKNAMIVSDSENIGEYGIGMSYFIKDNSFHNASRAINMDVRGMLRLDGNSFYDWKVYNADGEVSVNLLNIVKGQPLMATNNCLILPDDSSYSGSIPNLPRLNPVKKTATYDLSVDGFTMVTSSRYPLQTNIG